MKRAAATKRIPPFADLVPAEEGIQRQTTLFISAGPEAWDRARRWRREGRPGLVAAPGEPPSAYDWPLEGRHCALIAPDLPQRELLELIAELLAAKPVTLAVLHGPGELGTHAEILVPGRDG